MTYFGDVDVVVKLASCGFLPLLPRLLNAGEAKLDIRYLPSLKARLQRPNKRLANAEYQKHLEEFCKVHSAVEGVSDPDREEHLLQVMDPGEALLFAEAEAKPGTVVTGDKRALKSYASVSTKVQRGRVRVVCWEQLLLRVRELHGFERLRQGCCEGIGCDRLLRLVFSSGLATTEDHAVAGLKSYLRAVEEHSGDILVRFDSRTG